MHKFANTHAQILISNMKSDYQIKYDSAKQKRRHQSRHQIGLAVALRKSDRNNEIINLLSAPGYGLIISAKKALQWETRIANAVIDEMQKNNGLFIPPHFQKNVTPMFHLDNIDWLEDSADGKKTSHLLQLSAFQPSGAEKRQNPFIMDLSVSTQSCTLKPNDFNTLLECNKPLPNEFRRDCTYHQGSLPNTERTTLNTWIALKCFEVLASGDHIDVWADMEADILAYIQPIPIVVSNEIDIDINCNEYDYNVVQELCEELCKKEIDIELDQNIIQQFTQQQSSSTTTQSSFDSTCITNSAEGEILVLNKLRENIRQPIETLNIPAFAATNSLVQKDLNTTLTDVYKTPLIPGPASSYSAIYTALKKAQGINAWARGDSPTIVSLDLDLYEKVYKLVNSRDDLRGKFIPRLGELHAVFAHVRAIGHFIAHSGLEDAWIEAEWFDSDAVVRQVIHLYQFCIP